MDTVQYMASLQFESSPSSLHLQALQGRFQLLPDCIQPSCQLWYPGPQYLRKQMLQAAPATRHLALGRLYKQIACAANRTTELTELNLCASHYYTLCLHVHLKRIFPAGEPLNGSAYPGDRTVTAKLHCPSGFASETAHHIFKSMMLYLRPDGVVFILPKPLYPRDIWRSTHLSAAAPIIAS